MKNVNEQSNVKYYLIIFPISIINANVFPSHFPFSISFVSLPLTFIYCPCRKLKCFSSFSFIIIKFQVLKLFCFLLSKIFFILFKLQIHHRKKITLFIQSILIQINFIQINFIKFYYFRFISDFLYHPSLLLNHDLHVYTLSITLPFNLKFL